MFSHPCIFFWFPYWANYQSFLFIVFFQLYYMVLAFWFPYWAYLVILIQYFHCCFYMFMAILLPLFSKVSECVTVTPPQLLLVSRSIVNKNISPGEKRGLVRLLALRAVGLVQFSISETAHQEIRR